MLLPEAGGVEGQRGAGSHPTSHPRSHALDQRKSPCIFLTCRRNPEMLPGSQSFPPAPAAPAQTLKTLGPPPPPFRFIPSPGPPGPFCKQPLAEAPLSLCLALLASIEQLTLMVQER